MKSVHNKHILVVGKTPLERHEFVEGFILESNKEIYRLKSNLKSFEEYIENVRYSFPFIPSNWSEQNPKKWTLNQVWDFHLDWTHDTKGILIIIEEFGKMEEKWKTEIIRDFIMTSYYQEEPNKNYSNFQVIISMDSESNLIEQITSSIGLLENEKRNEHQILKGKLTVIDLDLK